MVSTRDPRGVGAVLMQKSSGGRHHLSLEGDHFPVGERGPHRHGVAKAHTPVPPSEQVSPPQGGGKGWPLEHHFAVRKKGVRKGWSWGATFKPFSITSGP